MLPDNNTEIITASPRRQGELRQIRVDTETARAYRENVLQRG